MPHLKQHLSERNKLNNIYSLYCCSVPTELRLDASRKPDTAVSMLQNKTHLVLGSAWRTPKFRPLESMVMLTALWTKGSFSKRIRSYSVPASEWPQTSTLISAKLQGAGKSNKLIIELSISKLIPFLLACLTSENYTSSRGECDRKSLKTTALINFNEYSICNTHLEAILCSSTTSEHIRAHRSVLTHSLW